MKRIPLLLVVDDNPGDVMLAEVAFELEADAIHSEPHGARALAYLESLATEDLPNLILLDLNMPQMDGIEFLARLTQLPVERQPPVVLMLGTSSDSAERRHAAKIGVAAQLPKPPNEENARDLAERFGVEADPPSR